MNRKTRTTMNNLKKSDVQVAIETINPVVITLHRYNYIPLSSASSLPNFP